MDFADFVGRVTYREVALPWGTTQVWDEGSGPPVVLLHGIALGRRPFFRLVPVLARSRRVVVPSLRGEDAPAPRATLQELTDDLSALLDALGLDGVTLFGYSFGGCVALAYGARADPRVRAIVVQGTFARFRLRPADRVAHVLSYLVPARMGSAYFVRRVRRGPEFALLAEKAPGLEALLPAWAARTPHASLRRRIRLISRMDLAPAMRATAVPLALARGTNDRVVPRAYYDRLREIRPDARHVEIEGAGHNAALTHPEALADLLLA